MEKLISKLSYLSEKSLFWGVFILVIFLPLYLKFPLVDVPQTFVSVRLEDVVIGSLYVIWFLYLVTSHKVRSLLNDRLIQAILLFFFIGALSLFSSIFLTRTTLAHLAIFHYLRRIEIVMLMPLVVSAIREKRQVHVLLLVFFVVVFLVNFYGLGQRYLRFPAVSTTTSELSKGLVYYVLPTDRVNSTFAGHYDLAVFLLMAITLMSSLIFFKTPKFRFIYTASLAFLIGISSIVLIITATRLSFVAAIVGVFISLILLKKKKFMLLIAILAFAALAYPSQLRDRFVSTFKINILREWQTFTAISREQSQRSKLNISTLPTELKDEKKEDLGEIPDIVPGEPVDTIQLGVFRSFDIRINVEWPRAVRAFFKNPFLGSGYSSIGLATDNDLLRSLGEVGALGTLSFLLIIVEVTKRILKYYKSRTTGFLKYFSSGTLSLIFAFLINSLFIDVFEASKVASIFWIMVGLNLAAGKLYD